MARQKTPVRFVHAFPVAWHPIEGKALIQWGVSPEDLKRLITGREIVSHVRYADHCNRINADLGTNLTESGINCPSPFNDKGLFVVASLVPGTTAVSYTVVQDGTAQLEEAGVYL